MFIKRIFALPVSLLCCSRLLHTVITHAYTMNACDVFDPKKWILDCNHVCMFLVQHRNVLQTIETVMLSRNVLHLSS